MSKRRRGTQDVPPGLQQMSPALPPVQDWLPFRAVPEPRNYFRGAPVALSRLPQALLIFTRTQTQSLTALPGMHYRYVLICCLSGAGGVILDGRLLHLRPGEGLLVFPYQSHYYSGLAESSPLWFFTTFEYAAGGELERLRGRVFELTEADIAQTALWRDAFLERHFTEAAGALCILLGRLLERPERPATRTGGADRKAGADTSLVGRVSAYIRAHLQEDCSLARVAAEVGISESRLRAVFRKTVGLALGEYIRRARIYRACQLLKDEGASVTQTAEACGFSSVYAFSRSFKQVMDVSPKRFGRHSPAESTT